MRSSSSPGLIQGKVFPAGKDGNNQKTRILCDGIDYMYFSPLELVYHFFLRDVRAATVAKTVLRYIIP
jgi:hypothetical protein